MNRNRDICFITQLQILEDAMDMYTRIYPYGAGNAGARTTLAQATIAMPTGYVMDTSENWIKRTAAETAYGQIEKRVEFKEIGAAGDGSGARDEAASNELARAALTALQQHSFPYTSYALTVTGLRRRVAPGDLIRVQYREYREGYTAVNVDEVMVVLEPTIRYDQSGVKTVAMVVAPRAMPRYPATDGEVLAKVVEQMRRQMALPQAIGGKQVR